MPKTATPILDTTLDFQEGSVMSKTATQVELDAVRASLASSSADTPDDDIEDPALPMQMIADIQAQRVRTPTVDPGTPAGQVVITLDEALYTFSQQAAHVLQSIDKSWDAALKVFDGNAAVIKILAEALQNYVPMTPYSASVSVMSPAGFPMVLTIQERSQEAFLTAMGALMGFLIDNQFTGASAQGVPF